MQRDIMMKEAILQGLRFIGEGVELEQVGELGDENVLSTGEGLSALINMGLFENVYFKPADGVRRRLGLGGDDAAEDDGSVGLFC